MASLKQVQKIIADDGVLSEKICSECEQALERWQKKREKYNGRMDARIDSLKECLKIDRSRKRQGLRYAKEIGVFNVNSA